MDSTETHRPTSARRTAITTAITVGVVVAAYAFLPLTGRNGTTGIAIGVLVVVAVVPIVVRRVRAVLRSQHPVADAISAVTVTSILVVFGSAAAYYSMTAADARTFDGLDTKIDALYYSITLMSTVGFGDIVPQSQGARLLTSVHIILTVALLGATIRLITWAARYRLVETGRTPGLADKP